MEERPVPKSMPKFLQEGAARQLARTSQLNTDAIRQARKNSCAGIRTAGETVPAGEIAKNAARNTAKAAEHDTEVLRNLHPGKQHPKRIACPVIRQDVPVNQIPA